MKFRARNEPGDRGRVTPARNSWRSAVSGLGAPVNPLRRRTDQLETAAAIGAACIVLFSVPFALLVGIDTEHTLAHDATVQAQSRTSVQATVLDNAVDTPGAESTTSERRTAQVSWAAGGAVHTSPALVPSFLQKGGTTTIWITKDGHVVDAPMQLGTVYSVAISAGLGTEVGALAVGAVLFSGSRWALNRKRSRAWDDALGSLRKPAPQNG